MTTAARHLLRHALGLFIDNPIFVRELRRRMRGKALMYGMIAYILIMSGISFIVLLSRSGGLSSPGREDVLTRLAATGQALVTSISVIQFFLVVLLAPVLTAGVITEEREKQTFDFLKVTSLSPAAVIVGCLLSTLLYVLLVLCCAIPLISISFLYGGVAPEEIAGRFGLFLALALLLSSAGLYISSISSRTRNAQTLILFIILGILIAGSMISGSAFFTAPGPVSSSSSVVNFWGHSVPQFVFWGAVTFWASLMFLAAATRKVYNPDDSPFSYPGYTVFFLTGMWLALGSMIRTFFEDAFIFVATGFMLVAVYSFGIRRFEMGETIWQVKKRIRVLRPVNEGVLFIMLVLGAIALMIRYWEQHAVQRADPPEALWAMFIAMAGLTLFLFYLGWLMPALGLSRRRTRSLLFMMAALLLAGGPLFYSIWDLRSDAMGVLAAVLFCTPIGVNIALLENFYSPMELLHQATWFNAGFYAILTAAGLVLYWMSNRRAPRVSGFFEVDESALPPPPPFVIPVSGAPKDRP
ncbi:MAG: hypothetical protein Kow0059_17680 [Candidatus Sumerlaeia bacterium]